MILANQTKEHNPTLFDNISKSFGENIEVETVDHSKIRLLSNEVKAVIRSGDFKAYSKVILVSGAGDRWYFEKNSNSNIPAIEIFCSSKYPTI